jgi:uncharacterized protein (TIGR02271 family)
MKRTDSVGYDETVMPGTEGCAAAAPSQQDPANARAVIPVLAEELAVVTRRVETGRGVRISKTVEEREERIDAPLTKEEVEVERVELNQEVDAPVAVRYEGDTMIVPILEEVLVVQKRLVLKEEIRITRRRREVHAPQSVVLRREHAAVGRIEDPESRIAPAGAGSGGCAEDAGASLLDERRRQQEEVLRKLH